MANILLAKDKNSMIVRVYNGNYLLNSDTPPLAQEFFV